MENIKDTMVGNAIADIEAKMDVYAIPYKAAYDLWTMETIAGPKVKAMVYDHLVWYNEPKIQDYN